MTLNPAILLEPPEQGIERVLLELVPQVPDGPDHCVAVHNLLQKGQNQDLEEAAVHFDFEITDLRIQTSFSSSRNSYLVLCKAIIARIIRYNLLHML